MKSSHLSANYWIQQLEKSRDPDEEILSLEDIERYNAAVGRRVDALEISQKDLSLEVNRELMNKELTTRLGHMLDRLRSKQLMGKQGNTLTKAELNAFTRHAMIKIPRPRLHVAIRPILIRCGPYDSSLFTSSQAQIYDRNACSTVKEQEVIQIISKWSNGMYLVRTRYALGWIPSNAPLSKEIPKSLQELFVHGKKLRAVKDIWLKDRSGDKYKIPKNSLVPMEPQKDQILVTTEKGFQPAPRMPSLESTQRPLTRRNLLTTAFEYLGNPYSYGGATGGLDCSRFLLDLFESFNLALPRHSGWQAQGGSFTIDLQQVEKEAQKLHILDLAFQKGIVLLYFPGHIMLYLGRSQEGIPMALHALGEYVRPCSNTEPEKGESLIYVQRIVVSDLELGRNTSRRAFIERITRLVVFGKDPGSQLYNIAKERPAAVPIPPDQDTECKDDLDIRIFNSPHRPTQGKAVRIVAASTEWVGPSNLLILDPSLAPITSQVHRLGGPPYGLWTRIDSPQQGRYTALLGDGSHIYACKRFTVRHSHYRTKENKPKIHIWESRWAWERDTVNLWSLFIEQLFDYPADDPRTWNNLHKILIDQDRNLLYDHLGLEEDKRLSLEPDCADLPYTLRAYFSWKLRLPFAFRRCSRGRQNQPPFCGSPITNQTEREYNDEVDTFAHFVTRQLSSGVHSSSGRTHPEDDQTDLYPTELNRKSLPPGTVFADPYGHIMIVTKWFPQKLSQNGGYGILMAAEAQPDGTIGRRRFWQGSFLFDPSTRDVGAGFKHFRPLIYDRRSSDIYALDNTQLMKTDQFPKFSLDQYNGSRDDFYEKIYALINPFPLDPVKRLISLIDALEESLRRRVIAVDNGERFMAENNYRTVEMPLGYDIFETTGPWEDYSTPSRDMRLLISIDTVVDFPTQVGKNPMRYSIEADTPSGQITDILKERLEQELKNRSIRYKKSDGSEHELSFKQIIDRIEALEMAYNPNDCIEIRWGASQGSDEYASCGRRADRSQINRMTRYRKWFHTRTRPPRGTVR